VIAIEWDGRKRAEHPASTYLKIAITVISVVQMIQTVEYYLLLITKKAHLFGGEVDVKEKFLIWKRPAIQWRFWAEVLIIVPQPFPYLNYDTIGLFMFVRLYVGLKVMRDFSRIYLNRKRIAKLAGYPPSVEPSFNSALSLKTFYYNHPIIFCGTWTLVQSLIFGWMLHVLEREQQPDAFDYIHSFYVSISMMLLGWPADVQGNHVPRTSTGTILSFVLATVGVSVFTLLLNYVINDLLVPSSLQKAAVDWNKFARLKDTQKQASVRLIQFVWRHYRKKKLGFKITKTKEEEHKSSLKRQIRLCKTMRWRKEKVERAAKDRHLFSHAPPPNADKYSNRRRIETYVDNALTEMKEELLNEIAKLLKKRKTKPSDKKPPESNEQELVNL